MTNENFKVKTADDCYVVRLGADVPEHLVLRDGEHAASLAAAQCGFSPEVIHQEEGVLVIRFIEGKVFDSTDVASRDNLPRLVDLLRSFHQTMPARLTGYPMIFWVFQVLRHYNNVLREVGSGYVGELDRLMQISGRLERDAGRVDIVFGHNDLLPANFIDDGEKIWLIDFDYAGFNSPLFDLANLASNSELVPEMERQMLDQYFDRAVGDEDWHGYSAMKSASLLREMVWSMVSESCSTLDVDYAAYTEENRRRFEAAWADYCGDFG